jgi:hypothetical protein
MTDASTYRLSDALLKTIAEGSGRVYPYEGRAMAAEIIEQRRLRADAGKTIAATPPTGPVFP